MHTNTENIQYYKYVWQYKCALLFYCVFLHSLLKMTIQCTMYILYALLDLNSFWGRVLCYASKVLTNEKKGGLAAVSFDRYRFKLFSRKFSHKFELAPSCESLKTAQPIIECKWHKQGSLGSFRPPTGWGLHRFLWKSQRE